MHLNKAGPLDIITGADLTIVRAGAKKVIREGIVVDVASGQWDPTGFVEAEVENIALQSGSFDTSPWIMTNATVDEDDTTGPDGLVSADKATAIDSSVHIVRQVPAYVDSTEYCNWTIIQAKTTDWIKLTLGIAAGSIGGAFFNLTTGKVGEVNATYNFDIMPLNDDWYLCWVSNTLDGLGAARQMRIYICDDNGDANLSYVAAGEAVNIFHAQAEIGPRPTSIIDTTVAAATRVADVVKFESIAGTNEFYYAIRYYQPMAFADLPFATSTLIDHRIGTTGAVEQIKVSKSTTDWELRVDDGGVFTLGTGTGTEIGWHTIIVTGRSGAVDFWIDGELVDTITPTIAFANTDIEELYLGNGFVADLQCNFKIESCIKGDKYLDSSQALRLNALMEGSP